ncbi:single-stranded-DNA-specific exonuclease RecJ [Lachnospiraceae bacterium]|jgi:single-stranded-DNA-specific exonuclease|nr:single-stranded-DNA-specific exonuclease RecJ [Lachnospiraceae bacterium]GFI65709.1 single-stranded-DNA-specific exonuclease RecJ [Lachnospiraceae bacterium]
MEKWYVAAKKADFDRWAAEYHISPVLARILRNRELTEDKEIRKFLYGTLEDCYSPWLLKDMDKAVEAVLAAVGRGTHIRVIGDYDVDGICSSYILTRGLRLLGASADTAIPHRIHDGYGLNEHLIREASQDGVGLIVTCDNGIAAAAQIELAGSLGIDVVVTDHHEVPFRTEEAEGGRVRRELLPPGLAVVDPKQEQCNYPFPGICGGVVAYKLVSALAEKTGNRELAEALEELLEFAALSTVCDVMELRDENRILVKEGLKRLRRTRNPGLRALMEVNGLEPEKLSAHHLGFVIGPCLNATGRLDTARRALELLQSSSLAEAMTAARELKELNDSRKNLTLKGVEQAEEYIAEHHMEQDKVMLIFLPQVHESLAGIIAGRIRERYNHPVFILTRGEEGVKGSGRSIEGYHMYEAMTAAARFFTKFGGHAMAAGLSMREEDIEGLRQAMNDGCLLAEEDFVPRVHIDVPMPLDYGNEALAEELELLEPFGVGNPKPLFAQKNLVFLSGYKMGSKKNCARYTVQTPEGGRKQLVFFGDLEKFGQFLEEKFGTGSQEALYEGHARFAVSVVYQLGRNTYQGRTQLQYVMQHYC